MADENKPLTPEEQALADAVEKAMAQGGGQQSQEAKVWWGSPADKVAAGGGSGSSMGGARDFLNAKTQPVANVTAYMAQLRATNPALYNDYVRIMAKQGLIGADASTSDVDRVWIEAVGMSADLYAAGYYFAPWEALELMRDNKGAEGGSGPRNGTFSTSNNSTSTTRSNSTDRNVDLSSASEARAFLLQAAERELGRAATSDEIAAFRRALNAEEQANPEIRKTTGVTTSTETGTATDVVEMGETVSSSRNTNTSQSSDSDTTTSGGMDRGQFAIDTARSANDYAEYQAATTYMNTMFAALSSPVNTGG